MAFNFQYSIWIYWLGKKGQSAVIHLEIYIFKLAADCQNDRLVGSLYNAFSSHVIQNTIPKELISL